MQPNGAGAVACVNTRSSCGLGRFRPTRDYRRFKFWRLDEWNKSGGIPPSIYVVGADIQIYEVGHHWQEHLLRLVGILL
jgi:hypothetical protein